MAQPDRDATSHMPWLGKAFRAGAAEVSQRGLAMLR